MTKISTLTAINKSFPLGDRFIHVLHDISLTLDMGQLTMLVGPSGCGKTTLISIISGILSPTSGSVNILDQDITHMDDTQKVLLRRKYIGFIFQQYNLLPALTAAENSAMPLLAAGLPMDLAVQKATEILKKVGMFDQKDKLPRQLSGGQQQRVAIARALVHQPKLIVCDEPTAALDASSGHAVMEILREIANDANRAVLIVSHDNRIYNFADRIIEMSDGKIIADY
ncbi:MAG: ABC transporter ATP-binding protein, partial [Alphaproteobacteria bacterium]|nr:ABC transporter ATP-binding protein [Alphaproteobacteria bacterium]